MCCGVGVGVARAWQSAVAGSCGGFKRLACTGWKEVASGRLRLREERVGGRGHDGAIAGRARHRGRREVGVKSA